MTDADIDRLNTRLERERRARRQAEAIAERGMRELWETNRELQLRVEQRTSELERQLVALSLVQRHVLAEVASSAATLQDHDDLPETCAAALRRLASLAVVIPAPEAHEPADASMTEVADAVLDRWQRTAAASRQLLSVQAVSETSIVAPWDHVMSVVDLVLGGITCHGPSGATVVTFGSSAGASAGVDVELSHPGWARSSADGDVTTSLGPIEPILSVATGLAERVGGSLSATAGDDGLLVRVSFPSGR